MTERKTSFMVKLLAWSFAIVGGLAIFAALVDDPDPRPANRAQASSDDGLSIEACMAAQDAVRERLKSPSSARFPGCALGIHEYQIRANESRDTVWVMGHVDAQNTFGAMLRSEFGVKLERQGNRLVAVETVLER